MSEANELLSLYKKQREERKKPATTAEECLRRWLDGVNRDACWFQRYTDGLYCTTHGYWEPCLVADSRKVLEELE